MYAGELSDFQVLLVANYVPDAQPSMQRFAQLLYEGLSARGLPVTLLRPAAVLGRTGSTGRGLDKWVGYADKFALFIPELRRAVEERGSRPLVVQVCDHSNSPYVPWVRHQPHVVTCHDLLAVRSARGEFREASTRWSGRCLQAAIVRGLRKASCIACDSEATRADVQRIIGVADDRLEVIHPSIAPGFKPVPAVDALACVKRLLGGAANHGDVAAMPEYLLHVGGNQWYKNRVGLIAIYAALADRMPDVPPLVVAGQPLPSDLRQDIERRGLTRRVVQVLNPSDSDLAALYSCAGLLLFPSLAEGYGWPVLEAMACGCRVVASGRAPLTEIGGDVVTYIDPNDSADAATVVARVLGEPHADRLVRTTAGLSRAAQFSSDQMIDAYIRLYRRVLSESTGIIPAPISGPAVASYDAHAADGKPAA